MRDFKEIIDMLSLMMLCIAARETVLSIKVDAPLYFERIRNLYIYYIMKYTLSVFLFKQSINIQIYL